MLPSTIDAPRANPGVISKPSHSQLMKVDNNIEPPVAKPFSRLSAYAITAAAPPVACKATTDHTIGVNPANAPRSLMTRPSLHRHPKSAMNVENVAICALRAQTLIGFCVVFFGAISPIFFSRAPFTTRSK